MLVTKTDILEHEVALVQRQLRRVARIAERRFAIQHLVQAIGCRSGSLNVAEHIGQFSSGIANPCQQSEKQQEPTDFQRPIAHAYAQQVRFLVQQQVRASQNGQADRADPHQLGGGTDQRITERNPHRTAIEHCAGFVKPPPFVTFHRKGLDHLDAAKRFGQHIVDQRHILHRLPVCPL